MARDDEPVIEVIAKMILHSAGSRVLIAVADDDEEAGFRLLSVEVEASGRDDADSIILDPTSSIGMIYSSLTGCAAYIPSEWTRALRFERAVSSS
jgi:hypothetical protein